MTEEVLKVGEPAPDFALKDDHGCVRTLKDFRGKKLILYFYPEDETSGCTIEAQGFRDHLEDFARAGWQGSASLTTMWRRTAGSVIITA